MPSRARPARLKTGDGGRACAWSLWTGHGPCLRIRLNKQDDQTETIPIWIKVIPYAKLRGEVRPNERALIIRFVRESYTTTKSYPRHPMLTTKKQP